MPTLQSPYGAVLLPEPSIPQLRESASSWLALAETPFAEAQANAADGDLDAAIQQIVYLEAKVGGAKAQLLEARSRRDKARKP